MLSDRPSDTAELFRQLDRRVSRVENQDRSDASVAVARSVSDTTHTSDSVSNSTQDASAGFTVGQDHVNRGFL